MSITRKALRQAIGRKTGQPFFVRLDGANKTATGGTTTTLIDTGSLLQPDNYWQGDSLYLVDDDLERIIDSSTQTTKTLTFLETLSTAVLSGDAYEIWSSFVASQVHEAINGALRDAWPWFFTIEEGLLVIQDGVGVEYTISSLSPVPRRVAQVHLEHIGDSLTGTSVATPGAQDYLKDTDQTFTSAHVGWQVRVYAGTSKGDYRTVTALVDANTLQVASNFTTTLDATSKYRLVDTSKGDYHWSPIKEWRVDDINAPAVLRLSAHPSAFEGYLLRVVYEAEYPALTSETAATTCPREWLEYATLARLYLMKLAGAPAAELRSTAALQNSFAQAAESIAKKSHYQHVAGTVTRWQRKMRLPSDWPF